MIVMTTLLFAVAILFAVAVLILNIVFAAEIFAGAAHTRTPAIAPEGTAMTVVVPANDEAAVIADTLTRLRSCLGPRERILVVADNCTDSTADIARAHGVDVIERHDRSAIGKGYALATARDHLASDPPDVVLVLDADCSIDREGAARLHAAAASTGRPVQAISLLCADLQAAPMVQVSSFAFAVKNRLRNVGLFRITGRALLNGTGMAFPWPLYAAAPLATGNEVEDLQLGLDLAALGFPALLSSEVAVWSRASSAGGTLRQRRRWEGGFLATAGRRALPTLWQGVRTGDARTIWQGLNLLVPPLTLLVMLDLAALLAAGAMALAGGSGLPLIMAAAANLVTAIAIGFAWMRIGRQFLSGKAALLLPIYLVWKIPLYLTLFQRSPRGWLRTGR